MKLELQSLKSLFRWFYGTKKPRLLLRLVQTENKWNAQLLIHRRSFCFSLETFTHKHSRGFRTKPLSQPSARGSVPNGAVWGWVACESLQFPRRTLLQTSPPPSCLPPLAALWWPPGGQLVFISCQTAEKTWMVNHEKQILRCTLCSQSTTCETLT